MAPTSAPMPATTTRRCYLLKLPAELRLEVYEYLIQPLGFDIVSDIDNKTPTMSDSDAAATRFEAQPIGNKLYPQILRTCKSIYDEAHPLFHRVEYPRLKPASGGPGASARTKRQKGFLNLSLLHRWTWVTRIELYLVIAPYSAQEDLAHSLLLAANMVPSRPQTLAISVDHFLHNEKFGFAALMDMIEVWSTRLQPLNGCKFELMPNNHPISQHSWGIGDNNKQWHDEDSGEQKSLKVTDLDARGKSLIIVRASQKMILHRCRKLPRHTRLYAKGMDHAYVVRVKGQRRETSVKSDPALGSALLLRDSLLLRYRCIRSIHQNAHVRVNSNIMYAQ